ncbi:MAG: GTP-binding protein [Candidatus Eremiobacteraeota bacterium]|nr:GTP-binding protein [Candidatus Eremiobacteraeota bacterium]
MDKAQELFKEFPPAVRQELDRWWNLLSDEQKAETARVVEMLKPLVQGKVGLIRDLLRLMEDQYTPLLFPRSRIAIVGPVNAGKTTLFNQFMEKKEDKGKVSPVPGTTREIRQAEAGFWQVVDTPGADHGTNVGDEEKMKALDAAAQADFIIALFDASHGVTASGRELYKEILAARKPHVVALNKIDLVKKDLKEIIADTAKALGLQEEQICAVSAAKGENMGSLVSAIVKADSRVLHSMGRVMPQYRHMLAQRWILGASSSAGVIGLTPIPFVDLIPLTALQCAMVLNVASIYGYKITFARAKELIATFGAGIAARTLFEQLSKLGGIPGWILAAAIASATTAAIGFTAEKWFEKGEKVSAATFSRMAKKLTDEIIPRLTSLGKKKPDKEKLEKAITRALEEGGD